MLNASFKPYSIARAVHYLCGHPTKKSQKANSEKLLRRGSHYLRRVGKAALTGNERHEYDAESWRLIQEDIRNSQEQQLPGYLQIKR
jgi:hypothetical protein